MPERVSKLETTRTIIDELIKNNDVTILGIVLLQFGNLFTDDELAESISRNGKFCKENALQVIKKAKKLALDSIFTT